LRRYARQPPADLLLADRYYQDLILHSPQLETTVMIVTARDLPLVSLQKCDRSAAFTFFLSSSLKWKNGEESDA
jgi:hypothetical protein